MNPKAEDLILKTAEFLNAKNYSPRTVRNYTSEMRHFFAYYHHKDPVQVGHDEIMVYLNYIKRRFGSGYDKCRMVAQAYSFFYKNIPRVPYVVPGAFYPRREFKLPEILSEGQVKHLVNSITNTKHRCMISLFYGTGLRLDEMAHFKMSCIDSERYELLYTKRYGKIIHRARNVPLPDRR